MSASVNYLAFRRKSYHNTNGIPVGTIALQNGHMCVFDGLLWREVVLKAVVLADVVSTFKVTKLIEVDASGPDLPAPGSSIATLGVASGIGSPLPTAGDYNGTKYARTQAGTSAFRLGTLLTLSGPAVTFTMKVRWGERLGQDRRLFATSNASGTTTDLISLFGTDDTSSDVTFYGTNGTVLNFDSTVLQNNMSAATDTKEFVAFSIIRDTNSVTVVSNQTVSQFNNLPTMTQQSFSENHLGTNVDGVGNAVSADFVYYAVLDGAVPTETLKQLHAALLSN